MSERQAKKLRKEQPEVKKAAVKKSSAGVNAIFAVIIVAFLAVGGYAVVNHYQVNNPKQPSTVEDFAEEAGITTEEFLAKYGLDANEEINGDTDIYTAMNAMTVAKYAEYNGTTVEALTEEYAFSNDVTADTLWSDAQMYVPMSKVLEMSGMEYDAFLETYGLTSEQITPEMLYKDAEPIITEAQNAMLEQMQAESETEADAAADSETEAE